MVHKRRLPLVGVHVDTPDWLDDPPEDMERPVVGWDGTNPAWVEDCCGGGGTVYDPGACVEAGVGGGALTHVATTHYHEAHSGPPPGAVSAVTSGGTDTHTGDVGTTPATHNESWPTMPAWTGCGGIGDGAYYNARHTGLWAHWTVASKPTNPRAALRVTVTCTYATFGPKPVAFLVGHAAPTGVMGGLMVGQGLTNLAAASFIVPASLLPAAAGHLWVGIAPLARALEGRALCHPGNWPYNTGALGAWKSDWTFSATQWVVPCDVPVGSSFYGLDVGVGDGVEDTFLGWGTLAGSTQWFVDGLLTPPLSYDNVTGQAVFDRAVPAGAWVAQSGISL